MPDGTGSANRRRDLVSERRERDAFVVLLHLWNLSRGPSSLGTVARGVAQDLAFDREAFAAALEILHSAGFVRYPFPDRLRLTALGAHYIQQAAGHRRSVRLEG